MNKCCYTINPLHRDGTSQKQRFPLSLAENFVQIDERTPAEILNFIRELAREFKFYANDNIHDGDQDGWEPFFRNDLSFVLSHNLLLDLEAYRSHFNTSWSALQDALDRYLANTATETEVYNALSAPYYHFTNTNNVLPEGMTPLPALISSWIDHLPEASAFTDSSTHSFSDLARDAREKLTPLFVQLRNMHATAAALIQTDALATPSDESGWQQLRDLGWEILVTGIASDVPNKEKELKRQLELLKTANDSLIGVIETLQGSVLAYLKQSFESYPHHNPQNALFLAFTRLFSYAQAHINSLGRKHLLYFYQDILRFAPRPLTPDQAAIIVELRKGVSSHVFLPGTLLKAGKDIDGHERFFQVDRETAVNQAKIKHLRSLFMHRTISSAPGVTPVTTRIAGSYASPIANSSDGLGGALEKEVPKWNMFGESQSGLTMRTMPDARFGWAIASPTFYMREGKRVVTLGFQMKRSSAMDPDPIKRAKSEAVLREAITAEFTHAKGWGNAEVDGVFWVSNLSTRVADFPELAPIAASTTTMLLVVRIVLKVTKEGMVPYQEEVHASAMKTVWPVIRLNLNISANDFIGLSVPNFSLLPHNPLVNTPLNAYRLFGGRVYKAIQSNAKVLESHFKLIPSFLDLVADLGIPGYEKNRSYPVQSGKATVTLVTYEGLLYKAKVSGSGIAAGQTPKSNPILWEPVVSFPLDPLSGIELQKIHLKVEASEIMGFSLENDLGKLNPAKPFQAFGPLPVKGSRLLIGSKEVFGKKLDELSVKITWQDPPKDLAAHYENKYRAYIPDSELSQIAILEIEAQQEIERQVGRNVQNASVRDDNQRTLFELELDNAVWKAEFSLLEGGQWQPIGKRPLFHPVIDTGGDASYTQNISFTGASLAASFQDLNLEEAPAFSSKSDQGFLRLNLANPSMAFGHQLYQSLYVKEAMRASAELVKTGSSGTGDTSPVPNFPNAPYTPVVKELRLGYVTRASINFDAASTSAIAYSARIHQAFHIHPFGHTEEHPFLLENEVVQTLLPTYADEGHLYIGFTGLVPPCTLSVYFQFVESSSDPDLESGAAIWSILSNNRWIDLRSRDILLDTTDELVTSGVVRFNLGEEMTLGNTLLDGDCHWLRVKTAKNSAAFLKILEIIPQAVLVSFADHGNNPQHLEMALTAGTISALKITDANVKGITQPYNTFGGKLPEQADSFLTRVSERLRHRQRVVNVWDYEHMVLEQFPSIYKVKCLNHTELNSTYTAKKDWEINPGHVTVVCIPDLRNNNAVNIFEPKTSVRILNQVTEFLGRHSSPWVKIRAANPIFEQIQISCKVGFTAGKDPGYYVTELESAIFRYLSPWAFDSAEEIVFGGSIHRSQMINFIEQLEYVDFVVGFSMSQTVDNATSRDLQEAKASYSRSILVSARHHLITSSAPDCSECKAQAQKVGPLTCNCQGASTGISATPKSTFLPSFQQIQSIS